MTTFFVWLVACGAPELERTGDALVGQVPAALPGSDDAAAVVPLVAAVSGEVADGLVRLRPAGGQVVLRGDVTGVPAGRYAWTLRPDCVARAGAEPGVASVDVQEGAPAAVDARIGTLAPEDLAGLEGTAIALRASDGRILACGVLSAGS
jgi:hypothetical protein